jgi:hypothetical protein
VKFSLIYVGGGLVSTATATITAQLLVNQEPSGNPIDVSSVGAADAGNRFRYEGDHYTFNLDTRTLSRGTYRFIIDLHDGSAPRSIDVGFK